MFARPTAVNVKPLYPYTLEVEFDNGKKKFLDVSPFIKGTWYGEIADETYFSKAFSDGYTIAWPNGQDLCPDDVWELSKWNLVETN